MELAVLFRSGLNNLRKVQQLVERLAVQEVGQTLRPTVLKFHQDLHQLHIILQLRVHHFDVLVVLAKESLEVVESLLYSLS